VNDPGVIERTYRRFADVECRGYSEAYFHLAHAVAEDGEIIAFLGGLPVIQPNLFFAAVQLLTGPADMPASGRELRAFLKRRGGEVADVMRSRRTQTNEVGRCSVLLPALPAGPLALVEVGASAGLGLLLDHFHYELGTMRLGAADSPVHLRCAVTGPVPLPPALPAIAWRRGLDLQPIDARDEAATRWLLACVWPDHPDRRRQLECALALARPTAPLVSRGDLVDDLPVLLGEAPAEAQLVVFHSAVLSYVAPERRQRFAEVLADTSRRRPIVWLSNEAPGVIPEVTALAPPHDGRRFLLGRTRFVNGRRQDEMLALAHPHGVEMAWLENVETVPARAS
jgi:hypothetical protein